MSRAKRVKKVAVPSEPPRDPRLRVGGVGVEASTAEDGALICYANYAEHWTRPARTPVEALRAAYAALGVALDQAEDAFGGTP